MTSKTNASIKGITVAVLVVSFWAGHLVLLLTRSIADMNPAWIAAGVLMQTFLYTGLFITAHDAMHGVVLPLHRKWNDVVGTVIVFLYALFSYKNLMAKHWEHHKYPASANDPDFHNGKNRGFFAWYFNFIKNYVTWKQILGMAVVFNLLTHVVHITVPNLVIFWVLPSLLSTFQLFYFGTYLPHRETGQDFTDRHRARSVRMPMILSLLTCYHFGGFHWEHHAHPNTPWWKLPMFR